MSNLQRISTQALLRSYRFHDNDRGTMTMQEECRRMAIVANYGAELRRRGIDPDKHPMSASL